MSVSNPLSGGSLVPAGNYLMTGDWEFTGDVTLPSNVVEDRGSIALTDTTNQIVTGGGSNLTTVNFPASSGAVTLTMPNTTDTMVGRATVDTLTNKTIAMIGNSTFVGTAGTVTDNLDASLTITAATSATRRLVKSAITIDTTGNTFSVSGSGSIAAVRGEQTLAATDTFTDGFLYGVPGKITMPGTMNEAAAARMAAVLGQVDLSTGTLTDGQICAVWGDLQGSAPTLTVNDQLYVGRWTNSMATGKKAQAFHLMYGAADFFLEASADGGSADWAVVTAGTYSTSDGYLLVKIYGSTYRIPFFVAVD